MWTSKLVLLLAALTIVSCNPMMTPELRMKNRLNSKVKKFIEKNPELGKEMIVIKEVEVDVEKIEYKDSIIIQRDTIGLAALLAPMRLQMDCMAHMEFSQTIHNYISNQSILEDTITRKFEKGFVKVWDDRGWIGIYMQVYEQTVVDSVEVKYMMLMEQKLTKLEKGMNAFNKVWNWLMKWWFYILIAFIFYTAWRVLKNFFPFLNFLDKK